MKTEQEYLEVARESGMMLMLVPAVDQSVAVRQADVGLAAVAKMLKVEVSNG
jgi:hypothetical protein